MFGAKQIRSSLVLGLALLLVSAAGCGGYGGEVQEEGGSPADATALGTLEPRHGGHIVELTGSYDAELLIQEGGMSFVFLYDAEGAPVPYQGKDVQLVVTTMDGKSQTLQLEGMGAGSGAHFMNPLNEEMMLAMTEQGGYTAEIRVTEEAGEQTGRIEVETGEH